MRHRLRRGGDFNDVAALEHGAQGDLLVVDAGTGCVLTYVAMDGIGKIKHRGAARQGQHLIFGSEHIDRVGEQVHAHVVPELMRIAGFVLDIE
ncbi:hypothetical protein D3C72_1936010 [compost metagenome]